jgi:hypothetical protein
MIPTRPWPENQEPANCLEIINSLSSLLKEKDKTTIPVFEDTKRSLGDCAVSFNNLLEIFAEDFGEKYAHERMFNIEFFEHVLEMAFRAGMEQAYRIDRAKVLDILIIWDSKLSRQPNTIDAITLLEILKQMTHSESHKELFCTLKHYRFTYEFVKSSDVCYIERTLRKWKNIFGPYSKEHAEKTLTDFEMRGIPDLSLRIVPIKDLIEESESENVRNR